MNTSQNSKNKHYTLLERSRPHVLVCESENQAIDTESNSCGLVVILALNGYSILLSNAVFINNDQLINDIWTGIEVLYVFSLPK